MKKTYYEKLSDVRWQKKRLQIFERDKFTCQECSSTEGPLHVHHRFYISGRDPWEYLDFCLVTLCAECHSCKKEKLTDEKGQWQPDEWETGFDTLSLGGKNDLFDIAGAFHFRSKKEGWSHAEMLERVKAFLNEKEVK